MNRPGGKKQERRKRRKETTEKRTATEFYSLGGLAGRGGYGQLKALLASFENPSGLDEDLVEHRLRQLSGEGVLLTWMVASEEG